VTGTIREISGREFVEDIRAGVDDFGLMRKYEVTKRQLKALLKQLADAGALSFIEKLTLDLSVKELVTDIRAGLDQENLTEKFALTGEELHSVCDKLVQMGLLDSCDLEQRPAWIAEPLALAEASEGHTTFLPDLLPIEPEKCELPVVLPYFSNSVLPKLRRDARELKRLLDQGMDPNARDRHLRRPALIWAAGYGNIETVTVLVERGADVHATGKDGKTALHFAKSKNHPGVRDLLLSRGAIV
jgi:ankyrin repeat protein